MLQKVRRHASIALRLLVSTRFQVLFHSPSGVLFTFPSRYWFTIGHQGVFSLGRWSSRIPAEFLVFRRTQDPPSSSFIFAYGTVTLYCRPFQTVQLMPLSHIGVLQPQPKLVWAVPVSLAATRGIVFTFSSSGY